MNPPPQEGGEYLLLPRQQKATAGRDVAPLGREVGATGFARGAPLSKPLYLGNRYLIGVIREFKIFQELSLWKDRHQPFLCKQLLSFWTQDEF